jgi:type VI secretion system protein ImpJ
MLPDAIQWHEGMLLVPQHFQQMALRQESLLHYHVSLASPFHWGVRSMEHDPALLAGGIFRLREIEAVMPDGLLVSVGGDDPDDVQIDLNQFIEEMREGPITLHLAVVARRPAAAAQNGGEQARYRSITGEEVVDENTGDGWVQIPRLRPRLMLIAGDNPPSRYTTFPIAKIAYRSDLFTLTDYIPPTLVVPVSSAIGGICSRIARLLREKGTFLAEELRTRQYDMGASLVLDNRSKIQSLVEGLPFIEANLHTGLSHPFTLYQSLCLIAGHVATLGSMPVPPVFAPYDHNNLRPAFDAIHDYIMRMIEEGIHETYLRLPFSFESGAFFRTVESPWLEGGSLLIGVRGKNKVREKQLHAWMDEALIGSEPIIKSLRERRILGARRSIAEEGASYITGSELIAFQIDVSPEFIRGGLPLQIVDMSDSGGVVEEIILFIPKDRGNGVPLQ